MIKESVSYVSVKCRNRVEIGLLRKLGPFGTSTIIRLLKEFDTPVTIIGKELQNHINQMEK